MNGCGSRITALFTVLAMLRAAVVWPPFCFFMDSTLKKSHFIISQTGEKISHTTTKVYSVTTTQH